MRVGIYGREDRPELVAVSKGCEVLGWVPVWRRHTVFTAEQAEDFDAVVTFGVRLHSGTIRDIYHERGVPVLVVDLPPLRLDGYLAIWPGEVNRIPDEAPDDRLDRVPFALDRPVDSTKPVLVCGQKGGDAAHKMTAADIREWARSTCRALRIQGREVIWRPHPQERFRVEGAEFSESDPLEPSAEPLEAALGGAGALMTHNSTCGVQALLRGVPVYCSPEAFYGEVASGYGVDLSGGARVPSLAALRAFFARLMYAQWTHQEIATGAPLPATLERIPAARCSRIRESSWFEGAYGGKPLGEAVEVD